MASNTKADALARLDFQLGSFANQLDELAKKGKFSSQRLVLIWARRLVLKAAWNAPKLTGRLRAGFWPIAITLGMNTIYTPFPNSGEGTGMAKLDSVNPMVALSNNVPYVHNAGGHGIGWFLQAVVAVESRMVQELNDEYKKVLS